MSSIAIAESIVVLVMIYAARGLVFACAFLGTGMRRLDSTAEGSRFSFRALILPGTVALPLLALRWARGAFHRRAFAGIAVVVPIVMLTAVAGRAPQPDTSALMVDVPAPDGDSTLLFESAELWRSVTIVTRVLSLQRGGYQIELSTGEINCQPHLLLYWSAEATPGRLPAGSRLRGPYGGGTQRFAVPAGADPREGILILYSLGHRSVFATAQVPNTGG